MDLCIDIARAIDPVSHVQARARLECTACSVRSLAVCAAMKPRELMELDAIMRPSQVQAKTTFISEGEAASSVYTINEGSARLYKLLSDGRRQIIGFALPGDFLGLALRETYGFSADALEPTRMCRFDRVDFNGLVSGHPDLSTRLHDLATSELLIAQDQMMILGRRNAEERIAGFLVNMRNRWARIRGPSVTVPLPMQRLDIADSLGLTIETVSRTLSRFARDKVILMVPDGVRILNEKMLLKMADQ